jgi:KUP system potassium uptake protein
VNVLLCIASLVLILQFRSSGALAGAYGIAVAGAMLLTACFIYVVAVRLWSWPRPLAGLVSAVLVSATGAFFASTLLKLPGGGWIPAVAAIGLYLLMSTWQRGRELYESRARSELMAPGSLLADLRRKQIPRVPGTAVFLTRFTTGLPRMLLHNIRHNRVVHEQTWLLTVETADVPWVQGGRVRVQPLGEGLSRVRVRFGFMEYPDLPSALTEATPSVLRYDPAEVSFFLGHDTVVLDSRTAPLARWRRYLFAQLLRLSESAPAFFRLPAGRVIELGAQVKI